MKVQAVMTRNVKFVGSNATLADAARVMAQNNVGIVPVVDGEKRVLGMVTDRDICLAMATATRLPNQILVEKMMSRRVFSCGPDEDLDSALETMQARKVRRLPVLDGEGKLQGILSMDDVVVHAETRTGAKAPELGYGRTVETLKAIYSRAVHTRPVAVSP
jgi:CBS domain-containing protein